jgi:hypothetical protein
VVAVEAGELGVEVLIQERVGLGGGEGGFEAAEAPEVPGGMDDLVKEGLLECSDRAELGSVGG